MKHTKTTIVILIIMIFLTGCGKNIITKDQSETSTPPLTSDTINRKPPDSFLGIKFGERFDLFISRNCRFDVKWSFIIPELTAYECMQKVTHENLTTFTTKYMFYNSMYFLGSMIFLNSPTSEHIEETIIKKYGPPKQIQEERETISQKLVYRRAEWKIEDVQIFVDYDAAEKQSKLTMCYEPITSIVDYKLNILKNR